jgi:hypothetical protein
MAKMNKPTDIDMEKPLIAMDADERQRAWDRINDDIDDDLMNSARQSSPDMPIVLAAVILISADGTRRCIHHTCEYGDGEGIEHMLDTARDLRRTHKIRHGERVEVVTLQKALDQFDTRSVPDPAKTHARQ